MIVAYMEAVDRDSAADRGCTGGAMARAAQVGPPGEIRGGFSFSQLAIDSTTLSALFVQPGFKVGQILFAFRPQLQFESLFVEARLIGLARVAFNLLGGCVSAERLEHVGTR